MALKKPLVIGADGRVQQLQPGDTISSPQYVQFTNGEAATPLVIGTPCYLSAADTMKQAQANASGTSRVLAMVAEASINPAATGNFITAGTILTATTQQWDAVTGAAGGLTAGTPYYLSAANGGKLITAPPTTTGQFLTLVGYGKSANDFIFDPKEPLGL